VKRAFAVLPWIALVAFALLEVTAHAYTRARVPDHGDFEAAARFVRTELRARDLIAAAPAWTDPIVRQVLGERIDLAMAGRSDSAGYERLWALSIRGARPHEAPAVAPELTRDFGRVQVLRWPLGPSPVLYDFVEHVREAQVAAFDRTQAHACAWREYSAPRGGGLGFGVLPPVQRFGCEPTRRGTYVAPVVMEDLGITPRRCVLQAPYGSDPLRVAFSNVPLGRRIVLYGGIYYEHERMREGADVLLRVAIDGREAGRMRHSDGDGWKRVEIATSPGSGEVAFEVTTRHPHKRTFCWAATTRSSPPGAPR
jgi:hypothetical protein